MTFVRNGKKMDYEEVVQLVMEVVKKDILEHLDKQEIAAFLKRLLAWHLEELKQGLRGTGCKPQNSEDVLMTACQIKMVSSRSVWEKGESLINCGQVNTTKEMLVEYIKGELLQELKDTSKAFMSTDRQQHKQQIYL